MLLGVFIKFINFNFMRVCHNCTVDACFSSHCNMHVIIYVRPVDFVALASALINSLPSRHLTPLLQIDGSL